MDTLFFGQKNKFKEEEIPKAVCHENIHLKAIDLYCITCNCAVCSKCIKNHAIHAADVQDVDELFDESVKSSNKITDKLGSMVNGKESEKKRIQDYFKAKVESKHQQETDRVSSHFRHLHDVLHQKEVELQSNLNKARDTNSESFTNSNVQIDQDIAQANEILGELEKLSKSLVDKIPKQIDRELKCKLLNQHVKSNKILSNQSSSSSSSLALSTATNTNSTLGENLIKLTEYGFREPALSIDTVLSYMEIKNSDKLFKNVFIYGNAAFQKLDLATKKLETIELKNETKFTTTHGIFKSIVATHDRIFIFKRTQYLEYDPKNGTWAMGSFADSYNGGDWQSVEYDGNEYIYLFGGCIESTNHRDINRFNTRTKTLDVEYSQTRIPIRFQTTCIAEGKHIYTIGGVKQTNTDKEAILERFDIRSKELTKIRDFEKDGYIDITSMCYIKVQHAIYMINREHQFFRYDLKQDKITKLAQAYTGLQQFYTRLSFDQDNTIYCISKDSVSEYNISKNTWTKLSVPKFHAYDLYVFGTKMRFPTALEAFKSVVYIVMPITCTLYVMDDDRLDNLIKRYKFVVYPPEAQTHEEFARMEQEFFDAREKRRALEKQQQQQQQNK
ncbi:RING zinc finger-containing protein [Tieghemostelium lacteum]|uniref:RING zinc finger-containing protein n=1 Tax=Tieghemostelium lacteum TaxID=361077 RepID=A0A151Z6K5_TIELA|nr:RING zinc finger-containing protein [Tieghemostelium lacteum]|eukprot:KYQ89593.1 RING zinc finger-containing protein [Tieghemostelium lacteum]